MVVKRVRRKRIIRGKGIKSFFKGVWKGIRKAGTTISDVLRKTGAVSKLAPIIGGMTGNPLIGASVGQTASQLGYGRRRRVRRKRVVRRGAGLFQKLKNVISRVKPYASRLNNHLKSSKWISNELKTRGYNNASKIASSFGYGRRKVVRRKRVVRRGRGLIDTLQKFAAPITAVYNAQQLKNSMRFKGRGGKTTKTGRGRGRPMGSLGNASRASSSRLKF